MNTQEQFDITLRSWTPDDLPLLERLLGDPVMTQHIGGPETPDQIRKRLERYCTDTKIHMFVIVLEAENLGIGSVGYWERAWLGQQVWESGWRILPEYQGRGIATRALELILERARAEQKHRFVHAFPSIDNAASNAICKKMGFILQNEIDFEYPSGTGRFMRSNDWCLDLSH
jgi:RimJ/RimL family protein N-acetyltransferase